MKNDIFFLKTPIGTAKITGNNLGISSISILENPVSDLVDTVPINLQEAVFQLKKYFKKEIDTFSFQINPQGTEFQKRVWEELQHIPFGKTMSYLELSKKLGDPKAIRAVASANGKNPLWIVIPCHRVIGSDGSLTGYAGGLWRKKWLLEHEASVKQFTLF